MSFTENSDQLSAVETLEKSIVGCELLNTIEWSIIESASTMRLGLQTNTDMLNRSRDNRVGDTSKSTGTIILCVRKLGVLTTGTVLVVYLELAFGITEGTKLDRYTGSDTDEWCQSSFIECKWSLLGPDLACRIEGVGVLRGGLETDFDDVKWLA